MLHYRLPHPPIPGVKEEKENTQREMDREKKLRLGGLGSKVEKPQGPGDGLLCSLLCTVEWGRGVIACS